MNTEEIIEGYLGSTIVNSIYQGSELVWPEKYFGNRYMIGGYFTTPKNKIIRLNNDDSIDHTWYNNSSYTSGFIYDLIYDNINKKIYAGGDPALEGGLVRYNLDGTKDNTFNIGTGFNHSVRSIIIYNSKIYVGGEFSTFNGNTQNGLVRLNMDGTKDNTFNIGTGFNNRVYAMNIDTINQKIYVGGSFTAFNGYTTENRLTRLNMNGSLDTSFYIGTGFDGAVYTLSLDAINQRLYVGGAFEKFNDIYQGNLVRLRMDGERDTIFNNGMGAGFDDSIWALKLDTINQKLYVSGAFTRFNLNPQNRLIRLNLSGSKDTSFNVGTGLGWYIESSSGIFIDNEKNKIYIAGGFGSYNDIARRGLARLNMNGSLDTSFNLQLNSGARTILKYTE